MKRIYILSLLSFSLMLAACSTSEETETATSVEAEVPEASEIKIVNVSTRSIQMEPFTSYVRLIGEVKAKDDITLSAEIGGKVVRFYVEEGQMVKKGQLLAKIDDAILQKDAKRARASANQARELYERTKTLWEADSIGSELSFLNAKYAYEQAAAALEQLEVQIEKTKITAPFNGVLETKMVEQGEMVGSGMPLARLIGTDAVKVVVPVPANYSGYISVGKEAVISFKEYGGKTYQEQIAYVGSSINTQSRTFKTEIILPNETRELKIDMIANVVLETENFESVIVIGQDKVFRTEDGYQVYVASTNKKGESIAQARSVKLGPSYNNRVVVTEGLNIGDQLITVGGSDVENKTRIQVISNGDVASR